MGRKVTGIKELDFRVDLPWKEDHKEADRLYKQIVRSDNPEAKVKELGLEKRLRRMYGLP